MLPRKFAVLCTVIIAIALAQVAPVQIALADAPLAALHQDFSRLLGTYVHHNLVDYQGWCDHPADIIALHNYIDQLAKQDPATWSHDDALAYWLNLYNAVTVRLILDHYPLDSIKDIGGLLKKSPWKRHLVTVAGRELTLNDIENDIVRPTFHDPRVHFALNCASMGCPPLASEAFVAARLGVQLDANAQLAMNAERWVRVDGDNVYLTKIFDWYGQDFGPDQSGVLRFIERYRDTPLPASPQIHFVSYDWTLNRVPEDRD